MKRCIVLLSVLLYCIMLKAQSVSYSCRYWFDQNHTQAVTASFSDNTWQTELDIGLLTEGIHKLHLQVADTAMKWSSPQTFLFFKPVDSLQENLVCRYWFDQDHTQIQHLPFGNGNLLLNVADLEDGLHTVNILLEGENLTTTQNYSFMKVAVVGQDTLDMSNLIYYCWFDQDFEHRQTDSFGDGHFLLDVSELTEGLHTVNVLLEGDALTTTTRYVFMKVPVDNPSAEYQYHCWFDNDISTMRTGLLGSGCFQLETDGLTKGFHTVSVQLDDNGTLSAQQLYMFYNQPLGGYGISRWAYWLNDDINNRITTNIVPSLDTLDIISLLPVETWPIRSTCFHFQPNGEVPYINAKNKVSFRFWDTEDYWIDQSAYYVDENVSEPIVADTLERNTITTIPAPRNNQIHWFKVEASRGDYLSFQAGKACTMQLFAPSGEEVYAASGSESIQEIGLNVWEDGTYYLAVHDVTGSGEEVSITYNWVYRYTISSYDVHLVGNGGCSTITFQGNGFNSLLDAYLVNWQNDTIRSLDVGHESNTTTTVSLNFYQENLGVYDAVFEFFEETIRINGALEVQEPVDILLTSSVSYPSRFLRNTPCTYTYTITNNGNMSAYAVPLFVFISTATEKGISHLEIKGLNLHSIIDGLNMDSLTASDRTLFQEWADEIGEDHYFLKFHAIDAETGDSIYVRSNYFFMNMAPFETKIISLIITSEEPISVWVTVPDDVVFPLTFDNNRGFREQYCCVQEKITCWLDLICNMVNLANSITKFAPGTPAATVMSIVDCACGLISSFNTSLGETLCGTDVPSGFWGTFWSSLSNMLSLSSIAESVTGCVASFLPSGNVGNIAKIVKEITENIGKVFWGINASNTVSNCYYAFSSPKPNCPPGTPSGGGAVPVNSLDPNDIHGYLSESGSHYMRQEIQNVQYEIEFENDTTLATAAAHTIIVRDTLDATKFDLNSLAARSITIGDKRMELNGEQTFAKTLDLRPEIYVIAQVEQAYDPTTGIIQWTIQSLDPMTMEPTDDPNQGVLPVNYFGNGVGFIDYSIDIKEAFADGTLINNRAGIIFDQEDVIMTPTWTNIVDAVKPTSQIEEVVLKDTLNFIFVSEDNSSGVWYHTLYYRNASTEMEWKVKKAQIFGNNYLFVNDELMTTEFLVMATDSAGNQEGKDMLAEYILVYDGPGPIAQNNTLAQGWNWWSTYVEQVGQDGLADLENGLGHKGLTIKSQNEFVDNYYQYMNEDFWYGSLESIHNEQSYVLNVSEDCNFILNGTKAMPTNHPITIHPNWNWIGYPVVTPQTVTAALNDFNPSGDDVIKSQTDYAFYYDGYGWFPDDFVLVPGGGYKYQSNATENKTLTYTNGNRGGSAIPKTESHHWIMDSHAYADNLNVTAVVIIDDVEQRNEQLELGAFVNGVCRGIARLKRFGPLNRYYAMLTVSGVDGERIEFGYIDAETGQRDMNSENHITFVQDAVMGKLDKPFEVHFNSWSQIQSYEEHHLTIYPNPVEKDQSFALEIPRNEVVTEITVTDMLGAVVRHESGAVNVGAIKGLPTSGVYVIEIVAESGNVYRGRLIVK